MKEYHKIPTVFKRDPETKFKTLLEGQFATPELEYLKDLQWEFTEKVDGTNIRVMWDGEHITFGGKTDNAQIPAFLVTKLQERFTLEDCIQQAFPDCNQVCLYGEGYGAKIQKGGGNYIPDGVDFILFDVKVGDWWLQRKDVQDVAEKLGLQITPFVGYGTLQDAIELTRNGVESVWGNFIAEGMVMRPMVELCGRAGHRIITKIKHKDFPK